MISLLFWIYVSGLVFWFVLLCSIDKANDELTFANVLINLIVSLSSFLTPLLFVLVWYLIENELE